MELTEDKKKEIKKAEDAKYVNKLRFIMTYAKANSE